MVMRRFLFSFFNFMLIVCLFVYAHELRRYTDARHAASVAAIQKLNAVVLEQDEKLKEQDKTIEQYKAYVDNVGRCIINGEW